jgi:hypothetical protein
MPRAFQMTWDGGARRWHKMIFDRRYIISCRQLKREGRLPLNCPESTTGTFIIRFDSEEDDED